MISLLSGVGTATTSGQIQIRSPDAGTKGVSGALVFSSGITTCGGSGSISIGTGTACIGDGGDITIKVGDGNTLDGGHISVFAGKTDAGGTQVLLEVPYLFEVDLVQKVVVVQLLFVH